MTDTQADARLPRLGWLTTSEAEKPGRGTGRIPVAATVLLAAALLAALAIGANHMPYDIWAAIVITPALLAITWLIARRMARSDDDPKLVRVIMVAAVVKLLVATIARYLITFDVYGNGDSARYDAAGALLAPLLRQGNFSTLGSVSGTRAIEVFTGFVYVFTGPTQLGGFMVFSWLAFVGCILFYRAFRIAYPSGDHRRYRLLVLFFPSLLYWPSSIGKDALMVLLLGIAALGVAYLLVGRVRGLVWLGIALLGLSVVRPHLALIVLCGLLVAVPLSRRSTHSDLGARGNFDGWAAKLLLIAVLAVMSFFVVRQAISFFKLDSLNVDAADQVLQKTQSQTSTGGSQYSPIAADTPTGVVEAVVTVTFRPFPFELHSLVGLLAGMEGFALMCIAIASLPRLVRLPFEALKRPYVAFASAYAFAFCIAFASISNFGILARERVQLLPMLFVLFCVTRPPRLRDRDRPDLGYHELARGDVLVG